MSIPKLKAYRLADTYDESADTDIQSMSNDELLPVSVKDIAILQDVSPAEWLVGVRQRGDARAVVQMGSPVSVGVPLLQGEDGSGGIRTAEVPCDGWVMGKANIDVAICLCQSGGTPEWRTLDKRLWDVSVASRKMYRKYTDAGLTEWEDTDSPEGADEAHELDYATFTIGAIATDTDAVFESGVQYEDWKEPASGDTVLPDPSPQPGKILVTYMEYGEIGQSDYAVPSAYFTGSAGDGCARLPFSDVYNGNRDGRCLHYVRTAGGNVAPGHGTSVPADADIDRTRYNRYEGNPLYRRKVMPLRVASGTSLGNGQFEFQGTFGWIPDGVAAPVLVERLKVESGSGRWIYKQLAEGAQVTKTYDTSLAKYTVSYVSGYYRAGSGYCYPDSMLMFYSLAGDEIGGLEGLDGDLLDVDFQYADTRPAMSHPIDGRMIYGADGYGNTGALVGPTQYLLGGPVVRREFLAIRQGSGYDAGNTRGDVLLSQSGTDEVSFEMPASVNASLGVSVYHNGVLVGGVDVYSSPLPSPDGWSVSVSGGTVTVSHPSGTSVDDLMASCRESAGVAGWRVPCYERVKKASLFVSSFPNWLKGHLNNDLDVFVGYAEYSGTSVDDAKIDSIYPRYERDGWNAMYPEGALRFTEPVEQYDFYDVFNYGTQSSAVTVDGGEVWASILEGVFPNYCPATESLKSYRLYCSAVMANVAHYDGIYPVVRARLSNVSAQGGKSRYMLLDGDGAALPAVGRRWVKRTDAVIRRMYNSGQEELPRIISSSGNDHERVGYEALDPLDEENGWKVVYGGSESRCVKADMSTDRVLFMSYEVPRDSGHALLANQMVVVLDPGSSSGGPVQASSILGPCVRVHVKVAADPVSGNETLYAGADSGLAVASAQDLFDETETPVSWTALPPMPDLMEGAGFGAVQDGYGETMSRYVCDAAGLEGAKVCFEAFSYRYATNISAYSGPGTPVKAVELMIYRKKGI